MGCGEWEGVLGGGRRKRKKARRRKRRGEIEENERFLFGSVCNGCISGVPFKSWGSGGCGGGGAGKMNPGVPYKRPIV